MSRSERHTEPNEIRKNFKIADGKNKTAGPIIFWENGKSYYDDSEAHIEVDGKTGMGKSGCVSTAYVFSPYKLIWNGDYYYVVGYSEKHNSIGSFRVDRIARQPKILEDDAVQPPEDFELNVYLNSMFRMYNGERKQIELICENDLMDAIIDKFGKDVTVLANDMKSFRVMVNTSVGTVFYSWVFGFGGKVAIKAPEEVKDKYAKMVFAAANALNG